METQLTTSSPEDLIKLALSSNANIEVLERLMALMDRRRAEIAKENFFLSLVQFQKACPEIKKDKQVIFPSKTGGNVDYWYSPLSSVIRDTKTPLADNGLAYQWKIEDVGDKIKVTCLLTHSSGHTEETTMEGPLDLSGSKNNLQGRGSTIEYLKRYTLEAILGLSTADDVDGRLPKSDLTFEEIEITATSFELRSDLTAYYNTLPKKWKDDGRVKGVFKNHEVFLKSKK